MERPAKKEETTPSNSSQSPLSSYVSSTTLTPSGGDDDKAPAAALEKKKSLKSKSKRAPAKKGRSSSYRREVRELLPAPYFYYIDHSRDVDDDPLTPLSPALSVPNFVIKLHAILICESLGGIIGWMPHGRSWKILDQSEFEKQVLPKYFKQSSVASFYRQANGWGFRRMLKGPDKGSFYNERFLRGLPFLCKKMKRIGGAKIVEDTNINHEPILWKISAGRPTPQELAQDCLDYIVLNTMNECIQEGGPTAKMPFVHNIEVMSAQSKRKAAEKLSYPGEVSLTATSAPTDTSMSMSQGGLGNLAFPPEAQSRSATASSVSSRNTDHEAPVRQQGVCNPHIEGLLHQHQRQLGYGQLHQQPDNQNQDWIQQQLRVWQLQNQNEQARSLLAHLVNTKNQDSATPAAQQQLLRNQDQNDRVGTNGLLFQMLQEKNLSGTASIAQEQQVQQQQQQVQQRQAQARTSISAADVANILSSAGRYPSAPVPLVTVPTVSNVAAPSVQENLRNIVQQYLHHHQQQQQQQIAQQQVQQQLQQQYLIQQQQQQQQQPSAVASQAESIARILSSAGRLPLTSIPAAAAPVPAPPPKGKPSDMASIAQQMGIQVGSNMGFPRANGGSTTPSNQHLYQADQAQGQQVAPHSTALLSDSVLQHLAQNQAEPASAPNMLLELYSCQATQSQSPYSPSNQDPMSSLLASIGMQQQQQHQLPRQALHQHQTQEAAQEHQQPQSQHEGLNKDVSSQEYDEKK